MGIFDFFGTTGSGWLTDRVDSRKLLFAYYGLRGLSLLYLPFSFDLSFYGLSLFAVFYGLDWIATVPPTVRLAEKSFGKDDAPLMFGWILVAHADRGRPAARPGAPVWSAPRRAIISAPSWRRAPSASSRACWSASSGGRPGVRNPRATSR